ncbi:arabinan endo-1,5-alpha-L-arabinosidase [Cellulomonas sp. zg-ZUI188]|uniref:Arabinan endo-1,5-alpha-L-arabinosidase n=1 Tax=Cellulomonas fengjieae TaxID=2819978 RepID=A0ABS3SD91_9CELL|nr:arabinan endo-1,5-alpha-L-arabinosidase [Cellulomonas fengjieae]QVI67978.1 arabinan endo-1,5-alpha-L-arabinosidase [Cellulomonas fengjieae]
MTVLPTTPDTALWGGRHAHDPTAVRDDDGTYWLFSTDAWADGPVRAGVQVRRSKDLVTWDFHGWALDGVPADGATWSGAAGLWAPDVVRVGDEWRMYWSASTFGSRTSAIGLAVAPHPTGPWADRGLVVTSLHDVDGPNAIDANAVVDTDGRHWMVYGSFFRGIYALELDPATGLARGEAPGILLARRPHSVEGAIEGAFVVPRPGGGYALVVSYDSLFSTYHVRVGVSEALTGPYVDRAGRALTDLDGDPALVGTLMLAGHALDGGRRWLAPGHASVLTDGDRQLLVHHVRDAGDPTRHEVQVRRLLWTADGWPVVSPQPWAGDAEPDDGPPTDPAALAGTWEVVTFDHATAGGVAQSRTVRVDDDLLAATRSHGAGRFSWPGLELVVFGSVDAVRGVRTLSFAGLDEDGNATLGTRVVQP